jgi:predicted RNA-binding Zn-ribbon protein involved in translation (DUF1610 family)
VGKPRPETIPTSSYPVKGRQSRPWHQDPIILERMKLVWDLVCQGYSNYQIADILKVDTSTVRKDVSRLETVWQKDLSIDADRLRSRKVVELDEIRRRALQVAEDDRKHLLAVLYDEPFTTRDCPGNVSHGLDPTTGLPATPCPKPHAIELRAYRDAKGSATYRSTGAAALNVARQALFDQAKIMGLVIDKVAPVNPDGSSLGDTIANLFGQIAQTREDGTALPAPQPEVVEITKADVSWLCPSCGDLERYNRGDMRKWPDGRPCDNCGDVMALQEGDHG